MASILPPPYLAEDTPETVAEDVQRELHGLDREDAANLTLNPARCPARRRWRRMRKPASGSLPGAPSP
jgi:hypothetical protein